MSWAPERAATRTNASSMVPAHWPTSRLHNAHLAKSHDAATTMAKTAAAKADDVTNADAETVSGTAQASRKGGNIQATTSADTTVPTAASGDRPILGGQADTDPMTRVCLST